MEKARTPVTYESARRNLATQLGTILDAEESASVDLDIFRRCLESHMELKRSYGVKALAEELEWLKGEMAYYCAPTVKDVLPEYRRELLLKLIERFTPLTSMGSGMKYEYPLVQTAGSRS